MSSQRTAYISVFLFSRGLFRYLDVTKPHIHTQTHLFLKIFSFYFLVRLEIESPLFLSFVKPLMYVHVFLYYNVIREIKCRLNGVEYNNNLTDLISVTKAKIDLKYMRVRVCKLEYVGRSHILDVNALLLFLCNIIGLHFSVKL